ncbi:MAG: methyltransferase domain-containing protein [Verrucomicrobiota bacterium]
MKTLKSTELISREACVFTGHRDLELLYSLRNFPVFMGCSDSRDPDSDLVADMNWYISRGTGSLQLHPLIPLDVLYGQSHNEVVGEIWMRHHREFAELIYKYNCKAVFEIGGAHGALARNYFNVFPDAQWTILEPNPHIPEDLPVNVIRGFLTDDFSYSGDWDVVVHSQLFEHIYNPKEMVKQLARFSEVGKLHIFSIPNLKAMLAKFYTNCLNFEHTCYLCEEYIDELMVSHGFEILEKKDFSDQHSLFYVTRRVEGVREPVWPDLYLKNKCLFEGFVRYNESIVHRLNEMIAALDGPVYLFGAHIFSQFLIGFGLSVDRIVSVLDNGLLKIGRRLYGTNLWVKSPKCLMGKGKVYVILKAAGYNEEIKRDILDHINPDVIFLE